MKWISMCVLFFIPVFVEAYVPHIVMPETVNEYITIEDPRFHATYYGELREFPHTYNFTTSEPITLRAQILVPDSETAENNKSGLIVRVKTRGVEEVARMRAKEAEWSQYRESMTGDTFRAGPLYEAEIPAGTYILEVSTPDNVGQYALTIGMQKSPDAPGYFELLGRIYEVKKFLGKSLFSMILSPLVYAPLLILVILLVLAGGWYWWRTRTNRATTPALGQP